MSEFSFLYDNKAPGEWVISRCFFTLPGRPKCSSEATNGFIQVDKIKFSSFEEATEWARRNKDILVKSLGR